MTLETAGKAHRLRQRAATVLSELVSALQDIEMAFGVQQVLGVLGLLTKGVCGHGGCSLEVLVIDCSRFCGPMKERT